MTKSGARETCKVLGIFFIPAVCTIFFSCQLVATMVRISKLDIAPFSFVGWAPPVHRPPSLHVVDVVWQALSGRTRDWHVESPQVQSSSSPVKDAWVGGDVKTLGLLAPPMCMDVTSLCSEELAVKASTAESGTEAKGKECAIETVQGRDQAEARVPKAA